MSNFSSFFTAGPKGTLKFLKKPGLTYKGDWVQVFPGTEIDRWHVGEFSSAAYLITVEFGSNKKELMHVNVIARPDQASYNIYGRTSIDDELITLDASVNNSWFSLKVSPTDNIFTGAKITVFAMYGETINPLAPALPVSQGGGNLGGNTETGSGTGVASNSFSTISVAGQNDVITTSPNSTLTLVAGSNISITTNSTSDTITFSAVASGGSSTYTLPTADTSTLGGVKVDGTTITINSSGVIRANFPTVTPYTLPTASTSVLGGVKVDGTTVTIANGVISAVTSPGAVNANSLTGTTLSNNVVNSSLTSVGSLTGLTVAGQVKLGTQASNWASSGITNVLETSWGSIFDVGNGAVGYGNNLGNNGISYTYTNSGAASILFQQGGGWDFVTVPSSVGGGAVSTFNYVINISNAGTLTIQQSTEKLNTKTGATGVVAHDFTTGAIWYHSTISTNFTANFTNVPTTDNRTIVCTLLLAQSSSACLPSAVQINGVAQTIKWQGGSAPTGNANKLDIFSFTLIRTGGAWAAVTGSLSTYG